MRKSTCRAWGLLALATIGLLAGCTTVENSKSPVEIRAAQTSQHTDWQKLDFYVGGLNTWVAPEPTIVCKDINSAERSLDGFGEPTVILKFTDDGAKKMDALSTKRMSRPVAIILDGKIIAAPVIAMPVTDTLVVSFGKSRDARSVADDLANTVNNDCSSSSSDEKKKKTSNETGN